MLALRKIGRQIDWQKIDIFSCTNLTLQHQILGEFDRFTIK